MSIDKDTVKYVAKLARIKLNDAKIDDFTGQLDKILTYIEKLNQIDTKSVEPTSHALAMKNVFREDENIPSLENDIALSNAPEKENNHFKVPKII